MTVALLDLERTMGRGPALADLLPYAAFDLDTGQGAEAGGGLFINVDGSVGFGIEFSATGSEADPETDRLKFADAIGSVLLEIPTGIPCQLVARSWGDVSRAMEAYASEAQGAKEGGARRGQADGEALVAEMTAAMRERYVAAAGRGFFPDDEFRARMVSTYLFVKLPLRRPAGLAGIAYWLKGRAGIVEKVAMTYERTARQARRLRRRLITALHDRGVGARPMGVRDVLDIPYGVLNADRSRRFPLMNADALMGEDRLLRDQVVLGDYRVRAQGDGLENGERTIMAFSLMHLPPNVTPGYPEPNRPGFAEGILRDLTGDYLLTFNFAIQNEHEALQKLEIKQALANRQKEGLLGLTNQKASVIESEIDRSVKEIHDRGTRVIRFSCHLVASVPRGMEEETEDRVTSVFRKSQADGRKETLVVLPTVVSALPMGFDPRLDVVTKRLRTVMSDRFVCFLPLWRPWRGVDSPAVLCVNRFGEASFIDVHKTGRAPHTLVLAPTGAGKTYFMLYNLSQLMRLRPTPYIYIFDISPSYEMLTRMVGGRYISIDPSRPVCINPLSGSYDPSSNEFKDRLRFWIPLLFQMLRDPAEKRPPTREEDVLLEQVLRRTFEEAGGREVILSDCARILRGFSDLGKQMAHNLYPFLREGRYGGLFDGPNALPAPPETVDGPLSERVTVFDLTACKDNPELLGAAMSACLNEVGRYVYAPALRGVRKYLTVDEAWFLARDPVYAPILGEWTKTMRKYNTACSFITQDVLDLAESVGGQAILNNASNLFLLNHEAKALQALREQLQLTEGEAALVGSLEFNKPYFNEFFYLTRDNEGTHSGVFRTVSDAVRYWAFTTEPAEFMMVQERMRETGGVREAIQSLAREYPFGLKGGRVDAEAA